MVVTTAGPLVGPEICPQIVPHREEPLSLEFDHNRPLQELTDEFTCRIERGVPDPRPEKYRGRIDRCAEHCGLSRRSISEKLPGIRSTSLNSSRFSGAARSSQSRLRVTNLFDLATVMT